MGAVCNVDMDKNKEKLAVVSDLKVKNGFEWAVKGASHGIQEVGFNGLCLLAVRVDLLKEYDAITKRLLAIFQPDANKNAKGKREESERQYNLNAVEQHKEALATFNKDNEFLEENNFKKGLNLDLLVDRVGGWDLRYLYPSTLSYTNSVYSYIFSKLKPEAQLKITEKMIKSDKKTI